MNDKQRRFCIEYVKDNNATQSAIRAGYSEKTAGQIGGALLKKVEIQKMIEQKQRELDQVTTMNAKDRMKYLSSIVLDEEEKTSNKLKAIDIMNKMSGEYVERSQIIAPCDLQPIFVNSEDDADLINAVLSQYPPEMRPVIFFGEEDLLD